MLSISSMMEVGRDLSMKAPKCYELLIQTIKTQSKSKNPTQNKLHQMNKILANYPNKYQRNNQGSQSCRSSKNKAKHSNIVGNHFLTKMATGDTHQRTRTKPKSLLLFHCSSSYVISPFYRPSNLARRICQ